MREMIVALILAIVLMSGCFDVIGQQLGLESHQSRLGDDIKSNGIFFRVLFRDDSLDIDYFLDANGLVGDQRSKLKKVIEIYKNESQRAEFREMGYRIPFSKVVLDDEHFDLSGKTPKEQIKALQQGALDSIDDILVPQQIHRMRQILHQRLLYQADAERFQWPLVFASGIGISGDDLEQLQKATINETRTFTVERHKLKAAAWNRLQDELPEDLVRAMGEELGKRLPENTAWLDEIDDGNKK